MTAARKMSDLSFERHILMPFTSKDLLYSAVVTRVIAFGVRSTEKLFPNLIESRFLFHDTEK